MFDLQKIKADLIEKMDEVGAARAELDRAREVAAQALARKGDAETQYRTAVASWRNVLTQASRAIENVDGTQPALTLRD